jgi:hypothetical protein
VTPHLENMAIASYFSQKLAIYAPHSELLEFEIEYFAPSRPVLKNKLI